MRNNKKLGCPVDGQKDISEGLGEIEIKNYCEETQTIKLKKFKKRVCKECGVCKSYNHFAKDKKGKYFSSVCKVCHNKRYAIDQGKKKLSVITRIYNGRFKGGKCVICGIDIIKLPCLTFHHQTRSIKRFTYGDIAEKSSDEIIRLLEPEDVSLVCFNCQRMMHATLFNRFKSLILDPDLYSYSMSHIEQKISKFRVKYNVEGEMNAIRYWMKKRIVIDYLFNGTCAGCGRITVFNNLPCFEFHHTDIETERRLRWSKIKQLNIRDIIDILLREKCICLCKNCHKLIDSHQFAKCSIQILGKNKGGLAKNEYDELIYNVQKYNVVKNAKLYSILVGFTLDKPWKRALRCVYIITEKKRREEVMLNHNEYTNRELSNCAGILQAKSYTQRLIKMGLVSFLKFSGSNINEKVYSLTKKGYDVINEILFNF